MSPCLQNRQAKGGSWRRIWLERYQAEIVPGETAFFLSITTVRTHVPGFWKSMERSVGVLYTEGGSLLWTLPWGWWSWPPSKTVWEIRVVPSERCEEQCLFTDSCYQGLCSRQKGRIHFLVATGRSWSLAVSLLQVNCVLYKVAGFQTASCPP